MFIHRSTISWLVVVVSFFLVKEGAAAEPLKTATVTEISGEVSLYQGKDAAAVRPATVKDMINGSDVIRTGKKSRAELEFADLSMCRLGSNTIFSFDPTTRDMTFSSGVAVVHVPPNKGGARIATAAATAAIQGDTLVLKTLKTKDGHRSTQFTALSPRGGPTDGNIHVTLNANPSGSLSLDGGQFAIVPDGARSLSEVVRGEIDVGAFFRSSHLLQHLPPSALREVKLVEEAQQRDLESGKARHSEGGGINRDGGVGPDGSSMPPSAPVPPAGTLSPTKPPPPPPPPTPYVPPT